MITLKGYLQPHQSSTAKQDHEDDKRLKPAVLHNLIASLPQLPPGLTQTLASIDAAALTVSQAHWSEQTSLY